MACNSAWYGTKPDLAASLNSEPKISGFNCLNFLLLTNSDNFIIGGSGLETSPPGTSRFPVIPLSMEIALQVWKLLGMCSIALPHWIHAGFICAYNLAAFCILSSDTHVKWLTCFGENVLTCSRSSSNPWVQQFTKSWSYNSSKIITCSKLKASAPSVPGRNCNHKSALEANLVRFGSITMSLAPFVNTFLNWILISPSSLLLNRLDPQQRTRFGSPS